MAKKKDTLIDEAGKIKTNLAELKKKKKVLDSSKTKKAEAKPTKKTTKKAEAKPKNKT